VKPVVKKINDPTALPGVENKIQPLAALFNIRFFQ
jgi:hypothetical protein